MTQCDVCGNNYDKSFDVIIGGVSHTFDSLTALNVPSTHSLLTASNAVVG